MEFIKNVSSDKFAQNIIVALITALCTYLITMRKIRRNQKSQHENTLGEKITNAYLNVKELLLQASSYELYDYENSEVEAKNVFIYDEYAVYSAFMHNYDTLSSFINSLAGARRNDEPYLDLKTAAGLYILEKYMLSLLMYIKDNDLEDKLKTIGTIVYIDISKWEKIMDKRVTKRVNRLKYKMYTKNGLMWKIERRLSLHFLEKSCLNELISKGFDLTTRLKDNDK